MMKYVITLILNLFVFSMNAQTDAQKNSSGASKLIFISDKQEAKKMAEMDLKNEMPFLLLSGGIAPVVITTDTKFEKKYSVYFYEFGCTGPENEVIIAYNETIFEYLNKAYGKKWEKEIRKDVVGFKDWRRK